MRHTTARVLSWLIALLGVWEIISPFVLGYTASSIAMYDAIIVGALLLILGVWAALGNPGTGRTLDWINAILGLWLLVSPFILGFSALMGTATTNDVVVGIVGIILGVWAALAFGRTVPTVEEGVGATPPMGEMNAPAYGRGAGPTPTMTAEREEMVTETAPTPASQPVHGPIDRTAMHDTMFVGEDVVGSDSVFVGTVKEIRDNDFRLNRSMGTDLYVPFDEVRSAQGRVMLLFPADQLDQQGFQTL